MRIGINMASMHLQWRQGMLYGEDDNFDPNNSDLVAGMMCRFHEAKKIKDQK